MFSKCSLLSSLNISNFNTSNVEEMGNIFYGCSSLTSINLSNFDTSKVNYMNQMFKECSSLSSLNISNFNTSQVYNMYSMFSGCSLLTSLNLTNFNTSSVTSIGYMFSDCSSLKSLNLSNFDTSQVEYMARTFSGCSLLSSLNLSNFNTSKVSSMDNMFSECSLLSSLDISNFNTSNVFEMKYMFSGCLSLSSLNLSHFDTSKVWYMENMFSKCSLLNSLDISNFNISLVENMENIFTECSSLEILSLPDFDILQILIRDKIFYNCTKLEYINLENANFIQNNFDIFNLIPNNLIICNENVSRTLINFFPEKLNMHCNHINNYSENNIRCYTKNSTFNDNHVCDICGHNFFEEYNISKNDDHFEIDCFEMENQDYLNNITENRTEIIQNIIDNLIDEFNCIEIDNGNDKTIVEKDMVIILTSTQNQKINEDTNNVTMYLGECENVLKNEYNISEDEPLYMLQIISEEEGMKIPKVEYEVYYPLNNSNDLTKLDLALCKDTKVEISIAVKINGTLDKYNPKSDYYNDICSKTTSESGTDISLKDRKNEYVENNMALCEENCELIEYDYIKEKAKCSCDIKLSIPPDFNIKFNKNDFFKSFTDVNNILNINIMKCYKTVLKIKSLKNNYGFYIIGFIVLLYFITLLIFTTVSFNELKKDINKIIFA